MDVSFVDYTVFVFVVRNSLITFLTENERSTRPQKLRSSVNDALDYCRQHQRYLSVYFADGCVFLIASLVPSLWHMLC